MTFTLINLLSVSLLVAFAGLSLPAAGLLVGLGAAADVMLSGDDDAE